MLEYLLDNLEFKNTKHIRESYIKKDETLNIILH